MTHKKGELIPRLTLYIYIYSMTNKKYTYNTVYPKERI